jgi:hypothetical protein
MRRRIPRAQLVDLRERLAQESARLMIEHGIVDYGLAKRKAAERLAVASAGALPSNSQIEACLAERQRIFEPATHLQRIEQLRLASLALMRMLAVFEPRLAGPVLAGTATINTAIELHLFADSTEAVSDELGMRRIASSPLERRFRYGGGRADLLPGFRIQYGDEEAVLIVFPPTGLREAPLSQVDRRPMDRASIGRVEKLLES